MRAACTKDPGTAAPGIPWHFVTKAIRGSLVTKRGGPGRQPRISGHPAATHRPVSASRKDTERAGKAARAGRGTERGGAGRPLRSPPGPGPRPAFRVAPITAARGLPGAAIASVERRLLSTCARPGTGPEVPGPAPPGAGRRPGAAARARAGARRPGRRPLRTVSRGCHDGLSRVAVTNPDNPPDLTPHARLTPPAPTRASRRRYAGPGGPRRSPGSARPGSSTRARPGPRNADGGWEFPGPAPGYVPFRDCYSQNSASCLCHVITAGGAGAIPAGPGRPRPPVSRNHLPLRPFS